MEKIFIYLSRFVAPFGEWKQNPHLKAATSVWVSHEPDSRIRVV